MLDVEETQRMERLDDAVAQIRDRFGDESLIRGIFVASETKAFSGGVDDPDYKFMKNNL